MSFNRYPTNSPVVPSVSSYRSISISATDLELDWPAYAGTDENSIARIMEVTTTGGGIILPSAMRASLGFDIVVLNVGSVVLSVKDNDSVEVAAVFPGQATYLYLVDTSTAAGSWNWLGYGASTATANAASLAGDGLIAVAGQLATAHMASIITGTYTLDSHDRARALVYTGGTSTLTIPLYTDLTADFFCLVTNRGSGVLTLAATSPQEIDGDNSIDLQVGDSCFIIVSSSGIYTVGRGRTADFAFTALSVSVSTTDVSLTSEQAANAILNLSGTLTGNRNVILPQVVGVWYVNNQCTGSFSVTIKTSDGGSVGYAVPLTQKAIVVSDGINVYNAHTVSSSVGSVTFDAGSASNPSITFTGDPTTGYYNKTTGQIGVTISGGLVAYFSLDGLNFANETTRAGTRNSLSVLSVEDTHAYAVNW